MKSVDFYIEKALKNIEDDRRMTQELLSDLVRYMAKDEKTHSEVGIVAAKYVETLQRSNEQLVKLSTLIHKDRKKDAGLSEDDKKDIYDIMKESN